MQHIVRFELFHQTIGDELVVVGSLQFFGHGLECHQKAGEIRIAVKRLDFGKRARFSMPLFQLQQSSGIDRTFEMEVQLSFGKRNDEGARRRTP